MEMSDYLIIAAIILIIGGAVLYIIRAKRKGNKCIGCPYGESCSRKCNGECHTDNDPKR